MRRAARYDGVFPIEVRSPDQLAEIVAGIAARREDDRGRFDVAVEGEVGADPAPYEAAGATWWLTSFSPYQLRLERVRDVARAGPG